MKAQIIRVQKSKAQNSNAPLYFAGAIFFGIILIASILEALGLIAPL